MANNQLLASDNFASGSLAAAWSPVTSLSKSSVVLSGSFVAQPGAATGVAYAQIWTGSAWPNDHSSELTYGTLTTEVGTQLSLLVRFQSNSYSGYLAQVINGTLLVFRVDSGAFTQLGSTIAVTVNAGDVWTFQAAGAVLNIYQNGKRIAYLTDTTYTSGSPGFLQSTTTNVSHSQAASWRGYNTIQQDGIWQKQGIVVPALASDLASSGFGAFQPSILFDGSAQILSGNVYKMWFTGGGLTTSNIYYAESTDGLNWTRRGAAVLNGWSNGQVLKNGSTYYMYVQASNAQGSGPIALYTSSDGLNWIQQSTTILSPGPGGAWDVGGFYLLTSPVLFNGTWYALYTGSAAGSNGLFKAGVATSASLIGPWTKYGSNPVISNAVPACTPVKVGNTWYLWASVGPTSPQWSGAAQNYDPIESIRYQSTDLLTWTNPVHSIHHSQIFESLNAFSGSAAPCAILDVNGKAYLYSISSPSDNVAPADYQIGLAIAPAPIASIVTFPEDATVPKATDGFTSGLGNLSPNWTTPTGASSIQIVAGNKVQPSVANVVCVATYTGATFSPDQYSDVTVAAAVDANSYAYPIVRCQTGSLTRYEAIWRGPTGSLQTSAFIQKTINGVSSALGPSQSVTLQVGDVIRLSVVGNVLSLFQNGTLVQQVVDLNNSIATGTPGMLLFNSTTPANSQLSSWTGGNAGVIPTYVYSYPDDRAFGHFPNLSVTTQGTLLYTVQNPDCRVASIIPVDSRAASITSVDSRVSIDVPLNSRNTPS